MGSMEFAYKVSIPYRLATNKLIIRCCCLFTGRVSIPYRLATNDAESPRTEYFVEVSIPYRLATN